MLRELQPVFDHEEANCKKYEKNVEINVLKYNVERTVPVLVNESKGVGDRVEGQVCRPVEVGLRAVAVLSASRRTPLGYQLPVKE
jgi:hypothetical protein